jgi:hypothetical protein
VKSTEVNICFTTPLSFFRDDGQSYVVEIVGSEMDAVLPRQLLGRSGNGQYVRRYVSQLKNSPIICHISVQEKARTLGVAG